jgi:hypothetical protein
MDAIDKEIEDLGNQFIDVSRLITDTRTSQAVALLMTIVMKRDERTWNVIEEIAKHI